MNATLVPMLGPFFESSSKEYPRVYLDAPVFAEAKTSLILVCVDVVLVDEAGRFVLFYRRNEPGKGWWWNGGREFAGELPRQAIRQLLRREVGFVPRRVGPLAAFHHLWERPRQHDLIQLHVARVSERTIKRIRLDPKEYDARRGLMRYDGSQQVRKAVASAYTLFRSSRAHST